jgi:hypothetical protein
MNNQLKPSVRLSRGFAYGLVIGWVVGIVWWVSLAIYFGPSGQTFIHDGIAEETHISVLSRCLQAPMIAAPWALVGSVVGAGIGWAGGWLEIVACFVGMSGAIGLQLSQLSHNLIDGWLAFTMPVHAFVGTIIGLAVGCVVRLLLTACRRLLTGHRRSSSR